jgi:GrpB-like predicted nucleotidyltransferase (UPF0157 family)
VIHSAAVILVPHDPRWSAEFERESRLLASLFEPELVAIHHIGSTAIPGIVAKPVIDMLAVVADLAVLDSAAPALAQVGYEAKGEFGIAGRRYFRKDSGPRIRTHQLHGFESGAPEIRRHLVFRDYLIAHPDVAREYSALKQDLVARFGNDMTSYSDGKTDFIRGVVRASGE